MVFSSLTVLCLSASVAALREDCSEGACALGDLPETLQRFDFLQVGQTLQGVSDSTSADAEKKKNETCVGDAQHPEAWNATWQKAAFIMGGMGKYGKLPGLRKCLALAETIGRIGGWQGRVYIMTDEFPDEHVRESVAKGFSNIHFRKIEPIRDGVDFREFNAGGGGGYMKTQIFDLPDIPEDILIWHDCDKLITQPDCVNTMFADASLDFGPDVRLLVGIMPPENGADCHKGHDRFADRCGDGLHIGVFAAHRRWSKPLIDEWKRLQQIEPNTYDRYTLYDAWKHLDAKVKRLPHPFWDHMWHPERPIQNCVNHLSGPRVWDPKNFGMLEPLLKSVCLKSMSFDELFEVYSNNLKWTKDHDVDLDRRYGNTQA